LLKSEKKDSRLYRIIMDVRRLFFFLSIFSNVFLLLYFSLGTAFKYALSLFESGTFRFEKIAAYATLNWFGGCFQVSATCLLR
jgi:hypothetical protein